MAIPKILDTTLRDGSYAINFQFTATDTALLTAQLSALGFELIEVGHGIGLGASRAKMGVAVESDEQYMLAAAKSCKKGSWGMFCIPGIAALDDLYLAAEHGMGFIRIGTNVTQAREAEPFVALAKKFGMYVCMNFMKSYACSPEEFAEHASLAHKFGADLLYIVDSAGGMLTQELEGYVRAVQASSDIPLGFHGHNNLGLAVANSLHALSLGVEVIDCSLQGIGRSAGNTPTELMIPVLLRQGYDIQIDPLQVMDVGEKYIRPLLQAAGYNSLDVVSGYAQFHSSYMGIIREYSSRYQVDPRQLIIELTCRDRVNAPPELVEQIAKKLARDNPTSYFSGLFRLHNYFGAEQ